MGPPPPSGRLPVLRQVAALAAALAVVATTLLTSIVPGARPASAAPTTVTSAGNTTTDGSTTDAGGDGDDRSGAGAGADPLIASVGPALATRGWFTEAGGGAESRTLERLSRRLRAGSSPWGLVVLAEPPAGGTRFFAEDLLDDLRTARSDISTVVVLTPSDIAADSRTYSGEALDQAVTEAIPDFQRDVTAGYERLFHLLAGAPLTDELAPLDPSAGSAPGRSTVPLFVAGGALLVVAAAVLAVIGSRRAARA